MVHREILQQLRMRAWVTRERSKSPQQFKAEVGNLSRVGLNEVISKYVPRIRIYRWL